MVFQGSEKLKFISLFKIYFDCTFKNTIRTRSRKVKFEHGVQITLQNPGFEVLVNVQNFLTFKSEL